MIMARWDPTYGHGLVRRLCIRLLQKARIAVPLTLITRELGPSVAATVSKHCKYQQKETGAPFAQPKARQWSDAASD
jgi:hypothetical protein